MSKKIQLQIPKPCREDWNKMTQVQQGRFCDSCEKKVVDFTGMNDEQVLTFFRKPSTGLVCGRFLNDQLNRDFVISRKRIPWLKYFFQFALPIFLTSLKSSAQGNIVIKEKITTNCTQRTLGMVAPSKIRQKEIINEIKGRVIDEKGNGMPDVCIIIKGTRTGTVSDSNGIFNLKGIQSKDDVILVASSVGYENKEITIDLKHNNFNPTIQLNLQLESEFMGLIVVDTVSKKDTALPSQRIVNDNESSSFSLFPNPVQSGSILKIQWNKIESGYFVFQFITPSGQIVYSKEILIDKEVSVLNIQAPSVSSGTYFLRLTNKNPGISYTNKIIIQ